MSRSMRTARGAVTPSVTVHSSASPLSMSAMASIAWIRTEVMRATGTVDVFHREKDPEARGDILGYQQRFSALPLRNKYIGAIYSGK